MKKWFSALLSLLLFVTVFPATTFAALTKEDPAIQTYLDEVSAQRGFEVTVDDVMYIVSSYEMTLEDFETIDDLSDFLGEVIQSDYSNLTELFTYYELDAASAESVLAEYGESLDDYVFVEDLDFALDFYLAPELEFPEMEGIPELDLTEEELGRLFDHLLSISEILETEETLAQLESLMERLTAFEEFDVMTELTDEQANELVSIFNELLSIFQMNAAYTLITADGEQAVTLLELVGMTELVNASLRIDLFNAQNEFLADIILTGESLDSDLITEVVTEAPAVTAPPAGNSDGGTYHTPKEEKQAAMTGTKSAQTVKGGELPYTGSNMVLWTLLGAVMTAGGFFLFRRTKGTYSS